MKVRVLIVEDELHAQVTLRNFIACLEWLELIGEATDGATAVSMIEDLRPELIFLDIQIPVFSGLKVLEQIHHQPFVIFTTAFDEFAITAFEFGALDYLLKPFGIDRFLKSLERARRHIETYKSSLGIPSLSERAALALESTQLKPLTRLFVKDARGRPVLIQIENILILIAADDYVEIHIDNKSYLMNITHNEFERRLNPTIFKRVHRSHIVNLDHIKSIESYDRRLLLRLSNGYEIITSRTGAKALKDLKL
jgi:DNA-binding LytR/AlgR family response regulator